MRFDFVPYLSSPRFQADSLIYSPKPAVTQSANSFVAWVNKRLSGLFDRVELCVFSGMEVGGQSDRAAKSAAQKFPCLSSDIVN